jgi:hypothetical protein
MQYEFGGRETLDSPCLVRAVRTRVDPLVQDEREAIRPTKVKHRRGLRRALDMHQRGLRGRVARSVGVDNVPLGIHGFIDVVRP